MGWAELAPGRRVTFTRVIFFCRILFCRLSRLSPEQGLSEHHPLAPSCISISGHHPRFLLDVYRSI